YRDLEVLGDPQREVQARAVLAPLQVPDRLVVHAECVGELPPGDAPLGPEHRDPVVDNLAHALPLARSRPVQAADCPVIPSRTGISSPTDIRPHSAIWSHAVIWPGPWPAPAGRPRSIRSRGGPHGAAGPGQGPARRSPRPPARRPWQDAATNARFPPLPGWPAAAPSERRARSSTAEMPARSTAAT